MSLSRSIHGNIAHVTSDMLDALLANGDGVRGASIRVGADTAVSGWQTLGEHLLQAAGGDESVLRALLDVVKTTVQARIARAPSFTARLQKGLRRLETKYASQCALAAPAAVPAATAPAPAHVLGKSLTVIAARSASAVLATSAAEPSVSAASQTSATSRPRATSASERASTDAQSPLVTLLTLRLQRLRATIVATEQHRAVIVGKRLDALTTPDGELRDAAVYAAGMDSLDAELRSLWQAAAEVCSQVHEAPVSCDDCARLLPDATTLLSLSRSRPTVGTTTPIVRDATSALGRTPMTRSRSRSVSWAVGVAQAARL